MNLKGLLAAAFERLRKMPVARWIKPLWKGAVKDLIQMKGDKLQEKVRETVAKDGPHAVDVVIDHWQKEIIGGIEALPLPNGIEDKMQEIVQEKGDELQAKIRAAVSLGGPAAVDGAFDGFQAGLIKRVDEL